MNSLYKYLTAGLFVVLMTFATVQYATPVFAQEEDTNAANIEIPDVAEEGNEQEQEKMDEEAMNKLEGTDQENILVLELKDGKVLIEMLPEVAPNHVKRIKELVREKFYDGIVFHRVIDGFMAQTGDPTGTGTGGSGKKLKAEFSDKPHLEGAVSMARAQDPDSADSQFFIVFEDSRFLDKQYTVWGYVVDGMDIVHKIKRGDSARNGMVTDPDKIISLRVSSDIAKEEAKSSVGVSVGEGEAEAAAQ